MMRSLFYVCPVCGNVIYSMGEAAMSFDRIQIVKLYPEGNASARFSLSGVKKVFFYCNRDGLFALDLVKGIDDREKIV